MIVSILDSARKTSQLRPMLAPLHPHRSVSVRAICFGLFFALAGGAAPLLANDAPPPDAKEQEHLLQGRLNGSLGDTFGNFANMFVVRSAQDLGAPIGLMSASPEIVKAELQPIFPSSYRPTLREFLDVIALETGSAWKRDRSGKFVQAGDGADKKAAAKTPIFEFTQTKREKPYEIILANGWTAVDKGIWTMCVPPTFPVGMDIYELGSYSADKPADEAKLLGGIPAKVSMQWAKQMNGNAKKEDLVHAKVGACDALFYEANIQAVHGKSVHWRQWVFMNGSHCYMVVSTIFPEKEKEIFPDVESMLKSFKFREPRP